MSGKEEKSIQHRLMDKIDYKAMPPEKGQRAAMRAKQGRPVAAADQNPPQQAAAEKQEDPGQQRVVIAGHKVIGWKSQNCGGEIAIKKGGKIPLPYEYADFPPIDRIGDPEQQKTGNGAGQRWEPVQKRAKNWIQQHGTAQKMEHAEPISHCGNKKKGDGSDDAGSRQATQPTPPVAAA